VLGGPGRDDFVTTAPRATLLVALGSSVAVDGHWRMSDPHATIRSRGNDRAQGAATLLPRMDRGRLSPKEVGS
jgi:hypothetical protein